MSAIAIRKYLSTISNDRNVFALVSEHHAVGYAVMVKIEEKLYNSEVGTIRNDLVLAKMISMELHETIDVVQATISNIIGIGIAVVDDDQTISIPRISKELEKASNLSMVRREAVANRKTMGRKKEPAPDNPEFNESFDAFLTMVNTAFKRNYRGDRKSKRQWHARLKDKYTLEDVGKAIANILANEFHQKSNFNYATPGLLSREDKLNHWMNAKSAQSEIATLGDVLAGD